MRLAPRSHVAILASFVSIVLAFQGVAIVSDPGLSQARETGGNRYRFTRVERCLMKKINRHRAHRGKRRLEWDKQLGYIGRRHARRMARAGSIWHAGNLDDAVTRWRRLGQTVGGARRCRALFRRVLALDLPPQHHDGTVAVRGCGDQAKERFRLRPADLREPAQPGKQIHLSLVGQRVPIRATSWGTTRLLLPG